METVEENRRQRLWLLEKEFGSQVALAERIQKSPSQVSQWKNASKYSDSDKRRVMDRTTARHIEKMTGKPLGWMDQPIGTNQETSESQLGSRPTLSENISPEARDLITAIERLDRTLDKKEVLKAITLLANNLTHAKKPFRLAVETKDFAGKPPKTTEASGKTKDAKKPVPNKVGD